VARTQQLFMQPQPLPAAQALALGLADAVLPTAELDRAAVAWALRLAGQPAHTLAWIKQLMLAQQPSLAQTLALEIQAQSACIAAPEFRAGAAAFLARAGGAGRS
jgi:enoyl-CoA hydratase/carnithine racemase